MSQNITVIVECFGALTERLQSDPLTVELEPPHTAAGLVETLSARFPAAADLLSRTACARGEALLAATDALAAGDEIALVPPVSGGQPNTASEALPRLTAEALDLAALMAETEDETCGALAVFGGTVRLTNNARRVEAMDYSAYGPLAARTLADIEAETIARFDAAACRIQHRTGRLGLGEVSVYVVVRAVHRDAAFDGARYAIEALKARVAVWKNEYYADGSSAYLEGTEVTRPERPDLQDNDGARP